MNFFTDLLNSYNKLKARKLKLVESTGPSPEAMQIAQQEFSAIKNRPEEFRHGTPYIPPQANKPIAIFYSKGSHGKNTPGWKFAPVASDGTANTYSSKFVEQEFELFASYFDKNVESEENTPLEQQAPQPVYSLPGEVIMNSEFGMENPDHAKEMFDIVNGQMFNNLVSVFKNIPSKYKKRFEYFRDFNLFKQFALSNKPGSLVSSLTEKKLKAMMDSSGDFQTIPVNPDPNIVLGTTKSLGFLFEFFSKDETTVEDVRRLRNSFAFNTDGSITVFSDSSRTEGLVFFDKFKDKENTILNVMLNALVDRKLKDFKIDDKPIIDTITIHKEVLAVTSKANEARGVLLELAECAYSLHNMAKIMPQSNGIAKMYSDVKASMLQRLSNLSDLGEAWKLHFVNSAFPIEDYDFLKDIEKLSAKTNPELIQAITKLAESSNRMKRPDLVLPIGTLTGDGSKGDVSEIYFSEDKLRFSLNSMGFDDKDFVNFARPEPIKELVYDKDVLTDLISNGIIASPEQPVYNIPVSLKNYLSDQPISAGSVEKSSLSKFIDNVAGDEVNQFASKARTVLGLGPSDTVALRDYHKKMHKLDKSIMNMADKAFIRPTLDYKAVKMSPVDRFIDTFHNALIQNSLVSELNSDSFKSGLSNLLIEYRKLPITDVRKDHIRSKVKSLASIYLKNHIMIRDIKNGDPSAKNYALSIMYATAASKDDNTIVDARSLSDKTRYIVRLKDVVDDVLKNIQVNDPAWEIISRDHGFVFKKVGAKDVSISFLGYLKKEKEGYTFQYKGKFSRNILKRYAKNKDKVLNANTSLEDKKQLLEYLLEDLINEKETSI
jgi:hypothetical protein